MCRSCEDGTSDRDQSGPRRDPRNGDVDRGRGAGSGQVAIAQTGSFYRGLPGIVVWPGGEGRPTTSIPPCGSRSQFLWRHRPGGGRAKLVLDAIEPLHAHRPHIGLVNIEALACGVPVAAYPIRGPIDILGFDCRGVHGGNRRIGGGTSCWQSPAGHHRRSGCCGRLQLGRPAPTASRKGWPWRRQPSPNGAQRPPRASQTSRSSGRFRRSPDISPGPCRRVRRWAAGSRHPRDSPWCPSDWR